MRQRVPRRAWDSSGGEGRRPRVLIEDGHPALAVSDFSVYEQAGFDVGFCSGPGASTCDCPLLRGEDCLAVAGADAVLHGLDPGLGIAAAIRRRYPDVAVVVEQPRREDGSLGAVPEGCVPLVYPCSVSGQVDALRQALAARPAKAR